MRGSFAPIEAMNEKLIFLHVLEDFILKSSSVSGVVLFGRAKEQAGILVEPISGKVFDTSDMSALSKFRNEIW